MNPPEMTPVTKDKFNFLTKSHSLRLPTPPTMKNHGNYIISLGNLCRWLSEHAMSLGVDIFPGFAASKLIIENDTVKGVITGDMGIGKNGEQKDTYQPGVAIKAKYTLLAEGCRGSLTQQLFELFDLRKDAAPQTYGIGLKELWEVPEELHQEGSVIHSVGWPLDSKTYGGSFLYHLGKNRVAFGFVVGLDYKNPYLSPYEEMQRFKLHPSMRPLFEQGKRISYGARALNEGGLQSLPQMHFPGGAIIGCAAGFLNVPKIKGTHTSMKTGMLAAEAIFSSDTEGSLENYEKAVKESWVYDELYRARNIRPAFTKGLYRGLAYAAIDTYLFRGKAPWTLKHHSDHEQLEAADKHQPIEYPKPDNNITFDRLTSVQLSNTNHEEDQPCHLKLKDESVPNAINLEKFAGPESRYCPAGVYEYVEGDNGQQLQINAQNCIHCKTCDIKDPTQNIQWCTPEGSGGPRYGEM
jgi:electron-transferring-flavoprotein dehydrogenase